MDERHFSSDSTLSPPPPSSGTDLQGMDAASMAQYDRDLDLDLDLDSVDASIPQPEKSQHNDISREKKSRERSPELSANDDSKAPAPKRTKKAQHNEKTQHDILVGYLTEDRRIPVYAHLGRKGSSHARTFENEWPSDITPALKERLLRFPNVKIEQVDLDDHIFGVYSKDLKSLSYHQKRMLTKKHLQDLAEKAAQNTNDEEQSVENSEGDFVRNNLKKEQIDDAGEEGSFDRSGIEPIDPSFSGPQLLVGTSKDDDSVPVYAQLLGGAQYQLRFCASKPEADESKFQFVSYILKYSQVAFKVEFKLKSESETRQFLRAKLMPNSNAIGTSSKGETVGSGMPKKSNPSQTPNFANLRVMANYSRLDSGTETLAPDREISEMHDSPPGHLAESMEDREPQPFDFAKFDDSISQFRKGNWTAISSRDERIEYLQKVIEPLRASAERADRLEIKNVDLLGEIVGLKTDAKESHQEIQDLKKENSELREQLDSLKAQVDNRENEVLVVNGLSFKRFPKDTINQGLFITPVGVLKSIDGKQYEEKQALAEYTKLNLEGHLESPIQMSGLNFYPISSGPHAGKVVQQVGPQSLLEVKDGRTFVRWHIRTEKKLDL